MKSEELKIKNVIDSLSRCIDLLNGLNCNSEINQMDEVENYSSELFSILSSIASEQPLNNKKIQLWESKLLDLSLRNNLLNFQVGKHIVEYPVDDVALLEDSFNDGHFEDVSAIDLKQIYREVCLNFEEKGTSGLFLTLGSLCWIEPKTKKECKAPILLMPIEIVRGGKKQCSIRKKDEEVVLNITLVEYLFKNCDIDLHALIDLPQDAHGVDVNRVFDEIKQAINGFETWRIVEEAFLGIFSFSKFVMWNDLHSHYQKFLQNDIIKSLVDGCLHIKDFEMVDAKVLDKSFKPNDYAIPIDVDSSQFEAIVDAGEGKTFVLSGPPGTGKSQTITNIIANALYHDKRVLFVAEKKAALDVVQSRLQKIGLAPFCLELHSNKANKNHFLQHMQVLLEMEQKSQPQDFERISDSLYSQRMELIGYIEALHKKQNNGFSLFDCINFYLSTTVKPLDSLPQRLIESLNKEKVEEYYELCLGLATEKEFLGIPIEEHPLRNLIIRSNVTYDSLKKDIDTLPSVVDSLKKTLDRQHISSLKFFNGGYDYYYGLWKDILKRIDVQDFLLKNINLLKLEVEKWKENKDKLQAWFEYNEKINTFKQLGLSCIVSAFHAGEDVKVLADSFLATYYLSEAKNIIEHDEKLKQFFGMAFEQVITKYKDLTSSFQLLTKENLVAKLISKLSVDVHEPVVGREMTMLKKAIGNKGKGIGIRGIIDQIPVLFSRFCPCVLMSPLSVSQYIDVNSANKFDIVIFDEASQMPTCEAIGAIARGNALIVVGDSKQMPPTSFFSTTTSNDEIGNDDLDSILDDCIALSFPSRSLQWHYRSKHESLIRFSNIHYYNGKLITFPSVDDMVKKVTCQHVDGVYENRINKVEAKAIVEDVVSRLKNGEKRSIGIIAFSKLQSETIEDELEMARASNLQLFVEYEHICEEHIFVKNLENVQGDERDIILFSICYGPDSEGHVSLNFGPLNNVGGERRLNVAVSRARYEMKVFATISPEMIDERRTSAEGVIGVKRFLEFAMHGNLGKNNNEQKTKNSVALQLAEKLQNLGYDVKVNVGTSLFRVNVAVVDKNNTSTYKLGILLDGQEYYDTKTVRDREIVQPSVLKLLGWNLMHVWTIDWLTRPDYVLKKIIEKL